MSLPLKDGRTFVIAEAGTAHADHRLHRRFEKALALVKAAADARADAVKFQWFGGGPLFCPVDGDDARAHRWRDSYLPSIDWAQIKEYAEACGLVFLASCFEIITVNWLVQLKLAATKVASRAAMTFPYDTEGLPQPLLISTGMITAVEAETMPNPGGEVILLQCEAKYPSTKAWMGNEGFSDHSGKPFLGIDAISRGCKLLEVHFMVNPLDAGPDLPACLTVDQLKLVCQARDYYAARAA